MIARAVPIPDTAWPRVVAAAREIADSIGIDQVEVRANTSEHHDVRLYSDDGNEIRLAHRGNSLISSRTGCRYRAEDLPTP